MFIVISRKFHIDPEKLGPNVKTGERSFGATITLIMVSLSIEYLKRICKMWTYRNCYNKNKIQIHNLNDWRSSIQWIGNSNLSL